MHDEFFDQLSNVAKVQLAAKLKDDRIGLDNPGQIRIFFPDMHIISKEQQVKRNFANYVNYCDKGKNDLLPTVARFMNKFKQDNNDKEVIVYQLGDFLDPWRETGEPFGQEPTRFQAIIQKITESHPDVWNAFMADDLHTNFLLGNHDFDLHRIPTYYHRFQFINYYIENKKTETPAVVVLHGDIFSWVERIPEFIRQFMVHNFSPKDKPTKIVNQLAAAINDTHKYGGKYIDYPQKEDEKKEEGMYDLGKLEDPGSVTDDRWNVVDLDTADKTHKDFLKKGRKLIEEINKAHEYQLRMLVCGHTHKARIAVDEGDGNPFFLMDCGAWLKTSKASIKNDGDEWAKGDVINAQIGVLYNNEARIYQLSPLNT